MKILLSIHFSTFKYTDFSRYAIVHQIKDAPINLIPYQIILVRAFMKAEKQFISNVLFSFLTDSFSAEKLSESINNRHSNLNWAYIDEKLKQGGVATIFFCYIKKYGCEHLLPEAISRSLSDGFILTLKENMAAIGKARVIFNKFKEYKIPVIVLKGLFLIEHIYPHPAMRGLSDIDILIRKEDIFRVDTCLRVLGYMAKDSTPERASNNPPGYLESLDYCHENNSGFHLHVHWHLVNTSVPAYMYAPLIPMDYVWEKAVSARIADTGVLSLCPEHAIIYLCEHALRVGHSFDRLVLICDIVMLFKTYRDRIDWAVLWEESKIMHLERFLFISLSVVEFYAGPIIHERIRDHFINNTTLYRGEKIFLCLSRRKWRFRGSSYLVYLSMNKTFPAIVRFVFRTFFPPRPILRQRRYIQADFGLFDNVFLYAQRLSEIFQHIGSLKNHFFNNKH